MKTARLSRAALMCTWLSQGASGAGFRERPWCAHGRRRAPVEPTSTRSTSCRRTPMYCAPTPTRRSAHPKTSRRGERPDVLPSPLPRRSPRGHAIRRWRPKRLPPWSVAFCGKYDTHARTALRLHRVAWTSWVSVRPRVGFIYSITLQIGRIGRPDRVSEHYARAPAQDAPDRPEDERAHTL